MSAKEACVGEAEDVGECERHCGAFAEQAEDLDGEQRVSADFEEVVVALDRSPEHARPDLDDGRLVGDTLGGAVSRVSSAKAGRSIADAPPTSTATAVLANVTRSVLPLGIVGNE